MDKIVRVFDPPAEVMEFASLESSCPSASSTVAFPYSFEHVGS